MGASASSSAAAGGGGAISARAGVHSRAASNDTNVFAAQVQPLDALDLALQADDSSFPTEAEIENSVATARAQAGKQLAGQMMQQQQQAALLHKQPLAPSAAANQLRGAQRSGSLSAAGKNIMGLSTAQPHAQMGAPVQTKKATAPPAGSMSSRIAAAQQRDENAMVSGAAKRPVHAAQAAPSATVARHTSVYRSSSNTSSVGLAVARGQHGHTTAAAQLVSSAKSATTSAAVVAAVAAIEAIPPPSKRASLSPATLTAESVLTDSAVPVGVSAATSDNVHSQESESEVDALCAAVAAQADLHESGTLPPPCMEAHADQTDSASADTVSLPQRSAWSRSFQAHLTLAQEQSDMRAHLHSREKTHAVHPEYMRLQPELNYRMREILLDWLAGVAYRFRLKAETSMLCASVLDRFLSVRECAREKFQLVGITCLVVASKYEESLPPSLEDFILITDRSFARGQILHMEGVVLSSLGFEMTVPLLASFSGPLLLRVPMDRYVESFRRLGGQGQGQQARDLEAELRHWVLYLSLASLQHHQFLSYPTSLTAAAIVALAHFQVVAEVHELERASAVDAEADAEAEPEVYWDAALRECSGGYEAADFAEVFADLEEMIQAMSDSSDSDPAAPAKYNSVTKRFQRDSFAAVALRNVAFPRTL